MKRKINRFKINYENDLFVIIDKTTNIPSVYCNSHLEAMGLCNYLNLICNEYINELKKLRGD